MAMAGMRQAFAVAWEEALADWLDAHGNIAAEAFCDELDYELAAEDSSYHAIMITMKQSRDQMKQYMCRPRLLQRNGVRHLRARAAYGSGGAKSTTPPRSSSRKRPRRQFRRQGSS